VDEERRRWGWMALTLGVGALATALVCALSSIWVVAGLFAAIGLGMLDVAWIWMRGEP
jgi:hypothetical protein